MPGRKLGSGTFALQAHDPQASSLPQHPRQAAQVTRPRGRSRVNILDKIVAHKRTELGHLPDTPVTVDTLRAGVAQHGPRRDLLAACSGRARAT